MNLRTRLRVVWHAAIRHHIVQTQNGVAHCECGTILGTFRT